jgi:hypothetical protein
MRAAAVVALLLAVTLVEGAVWGKGILHNTPSISTRTAKSSVSKFEAHPSQDDSSPSLMRLRGGIEYYDDRMDLGDAIKALKQAR